MVGALYGPSTVPCHSKDISREPLLSFKANVYNFCIADVQEIKPKCTFYVWEEFNGKKGSTEIYSCIYKYLQENVLHKNKENRPKK